jgi:hypothetical protein
MLGDVTATVASTARICDTSTAVAMPSRDPTSSERTRVLSSRSDTRRFHRLKRAERALITPATAALNADIAASASNRRENQPNETSEAAATNASAPKTNHTRYTRSPGYEPGGGHISKREPCDDSDMHDPLFRRT